MGKHSKQNKAKGLQSFAMKALEAAKHNSIITALVVNKELELISAGCLVKNPEDPNVMFFRSRTHKIPDHFVSALGEAVGCEIFIQQPVSKDDVKPDAPATDDATLPKEAQTMAMAESVREMMDKPQVDPEVIQVVTDVTEQAAARVADAPQ